MAYEFRNGKVYEVKEVDLTEIEKEVKQVVAYINQQNDLIKPLSSNVERLKNELNQEILKYENAIERAKERYNADISNNEKTILTYKNEIEKAKNVLEDKREVIKTAFPEANNVIGF